MSCLAANAYCRCRRPAELLVRLRNGPEGHAGNLETEAEGERAHAPAGLRQGLVAGISARSALETAQLPEDQIVMSFLRAGQICAAQLTAEAGVAPATKASGRSRGVVSRFACIRRLRVAVSRSADTAGHAFAWAAEISSSARRRGCRHAHASRMLVRTRRPVLWRARHDHRAAFQAA